MRIKNYFTVLFFLLLTCTLKTSAQSLVQATDSVNALFTRFIQTDTDKDVVLLTDRNIYMAGENIWFKAYAVNADNGKPDLTSGNLFAELVNEKDSLIEQLVLDNASLHTAGAFSLPELIATGFYWIRCYTARQFKNDSSKIFLHPVFIINSQLHDENLYAKQFEKNLIKQTKLNPFIHFFAERLTAIPGIISTGVIEIKDGYNNPLLANGDLVNSKDSIITSFKTNSFGLARLTFVNNPEETYTAVFYLNEKAIRYQLPAVNKTSIQLSVANQTAKTIKAFVTLEDAEHADLHTTILAVCRDSLYYAAVGTGNYGIVIPTDNFPGGIVRLLLFNENKTLINERKIYISKENVELEIKTDKKKYSERENVNVHVKAKGPNKKPIASILNVSVQDEGIGQFSNSIEANTLPLPGDFLLNSWLNRYHLQYSADAIDLLMVTKKSIFQQPTGTVLNKETAEYNDNNKLQNLTGKIINKKGAGISDRIVTAIAKNNSGFFIDVDTTDKNGKFSLPIPQGYDSLQFSLQVTNKHQVQILTDSIKINDFHYPDFSTPLFLKQQFLANNINTLALLKKYHVDTTITFQGKGWLKPVTVKTVKKEVLNYDESKRINLISQILTSDKFRYGGYQSVSNALLTVPGVSLLGGDIVIFGNTPTADMKGILRPLLVVDGVVMGNVGLSYFDDLAPADVDFIEVLRGAEAAYYGIKGAGGVISVNMRHGPDPTFYGKNNLRVVRPVTYHVSPKFQMPDYSNKEIKNSSNPDPRTTIYWNGNVATDTNGEANINFYTADNITNYTITITALTANGDLVSKCITVNNAGKSRSGFQ